MSPTQLGIYFRENPIQLIKSSASYQVVWGLNHLTVQITKEDIIPNRCGRKGS